MKKVLLFTACFNLVVALIHTILGHFDLIVPFEKVQFDTISKAILHACWHMVTVVLFLSSIVFTYIAFQPKPSGSAPILLLLGTLYICFSMVFAIVCWGYGIFLPQVFLLLPIGIMGLWGGGRYQMSHLS